MSSAINLGYSAWGFLGNGVTDTPDGGRSHRLVLLKELMRRGITIHMLQQNRDLHESGEDFSSEQLVFRDDMPPLDAIFFEYRWRIPGRNYGLSATDPAYTPDWDRQTALINHYLAQGIPIIIWDKDQQLTPEETERFIGHNVTIFEPSLQPSSGRKSLLFPLDTARLARAAKQLEQYNPVDRDHILTYIGNQYDRDASFEKYYCQTAQLLGEPAMVYGKWNTLHPATKQPFHDVVFHGRVGYAATANLYARSFATILIAPDRYYATGQYTQRLFEACWRLCIPFVPKEYLQATEIFPAELVVDSAEDAARKITELRHQPRKTKRLLQLLFARLELYSPERQVDTILQAMGRPPTPSQNRNEVRSIIWHNTPAISKTYTDADRFASEQYFNQHFKAWGFDVPTILAVQTGEKQIVFARSAGTTVSKFSKSQLMLCVATLAEICNKQSQDDAQQIAKRYCASVRKTIRLLAAHMNFSINTPQLDTLLQTLQTNFRVSLFKDAQVSNWRVDQERVYMLDFDYVRPSFYLADLAQLLNYQAGSSQDTADALQHFVRSLTPPVTRQPATLAKLLLLARAQAYLAAITRNPHHSPHRRTQFETQAKQILHTLQVIQ